MQMNHAKIVQNYQEVYNDESNYYKRTRLEYRAMNMIKTGILRKTSFYFKKVKQDKIFNVSKTSAISYCNQIDTLFSFLNENFEDRWDIQLQIVNSGVDGFKYTPNLILYYPDLTVTTTCEEHYQEDIKDLYVVFQINYLEDTKAIGFTNMRGFRTTYSVVQYYSSYVHSHLKVLERTNMQEKGFYAKEFCLGDSGLSNLLGNMILEKATKDSLAFFMYILEGVLETESEEGVPYINISSISEAKIQTQNPITPTRFGDSDQNLVYSILKRKITNNEVKLDFKFQDGLPYLETNDHFHETLKDCLLDYDETTEENARRFFSSLFVSTDNFGSISYFTLPQANPGVAIPFVNDEKLFFYFRDKKIYFQITDLENYTEGEQEDFDLRELLRSYKVKELKVKIFKKRIDEEIQNKFIAENARNPQTSNTQESLQEDQVHL